MLSFPINLLRNSLNVWDYSGYWCTESYIVTILLIRLLWNDKNSWEKPFLQNSWRYFFSTTNGQSPNTENSVKFSSPNTHEINWRTSVVTILNTTKHHDQLTQDLHIIRSDLGSIIQLFQNRGTQYLAVQANTQSWNCKNDTLSLWCQVVSSHVWYMDMTTIDYPTTELLPHLSSRPPSCPTSYNPYIFHWLLSVRDRATSTSSVLFLFFLTSTPAMS